MHDQIMQVRSRSTTDHLQDVVVIQLRKYGVILPKYFVFYFAMDRAILHIHAKR